MVKFYSFIEGKSYLKKDIPISFIENGAFSINKNGTLKLQVCGLANIQGKNYFFFPKGYNDQSSSSQKKETAKLLFHSILKYKNTVTLSEDELDWLGKDSNDSSYLNLVDWLISDYLSYGFFFESLKSQDVNGKGKINWSKTIKTKLPFVEKNRFHYLEVLTAKNENNSNNLITQIHKKVVYECLEKYGWLYSIPNSTMHIELPLSVEEQVLLLQKRLRDTYAGHDIKLLTSLIQYLQSVKGSIHDYSLVTPYFYNIWEEMLQHSFQHDPFLQNHVPKPYWVVDSNKMYTRQIPDILVKIEDGLVILDAKYYSTSTGELSRFPGWESIVKQLYYSKSLEDKYKNIKNIFVLPDTIRCNSGFKKIGYTSVEGKESDFGYVFAFGIDIDLVLKNYTRHTYLTNIFFEIIALADLKEF
ncbi:LlaJI family restriction endonuclease [Trichococcus sp.]|uniref:LlaJI family restriction endonuclease n=1 Tax=Trichococcus sp. TaxID=1985464 RepID=UPI003C7B5289